MILTMAIHIDAQFKFIIIGANIKGAVVRIDVFFYQVEHGSHCGF